MEVVCGLNSFNLANILMIAAARAVGLIALKDMRGPERRKPKDLFIISYFSAPRFTFGFLHEASQHHAYISAE